MQLPYRYFFPDLGSNFRESFLVSLLLRRVNGRLPSVLVGKSGDRFNEGIFPHPPFPFLSHEVSF